MLIVYLVSWIEVNIMFLGCLSQFGCLHKIDIIYLLLGGQLASQNQVCLHFSGNRWLAVQIVHWFCWFVPRCIQSTNAGSMPFLLVYHILRCRVFQYGALGYCHRDLGHHIQPCFIPPFPLWVGNWQAVLSVALLITNVLGASQLAVCPYTARFWAL